MTPSLTTLADLVLPRHCALCSAPGELDRGLCRPCHVELASGLLDPPRLALPDPVPPGFPACSTAASGSAVRGLVTAWKDEGRRDVEPLLVGLLAAAVPVVLPTDVRARARWRESPVLIVPVPSSPRSRRARGWSPMASLAGHLAGLLPEAAAVRALRHRRTVADQSRLGWDARRRNLHGAMSVSAEVDGCFCLLVDDMCTTGATLTEAARALRSAGAAEVVAATCAASLRKRLPRAREATSVRS